MYTIFYEVTLQIITHIYCGGMERAGLFVFPLLTCKNSLHILDTSPLYDMFLLPMSGLCFHFLNSVFRGTEVLNRADLPVLCGCFPLAIYFTFGSVYMSMPLSHFIPAYPSPSPCPQVHSLVGLCLYSCLAPRFFRTFFFLFHICVLAYDICFSLSDLLHSV